MPDHFHFGFDMFMFVGISAWVFLNLLRLLAAQLAQSDGPLGALGAALGGTL
jgi:hypothetical protein